ncbi:C2H2 type zinc-finger-domain-containing protein [Schizothecium vesticola]|uniref:C2H2 type zinc-finger-domain-containing protein n=1 Tax=Schizothecium vesticola TaxID=314040 RepID=A0AA40F390_9PEZI|nr:C2H2 type zinc-finger-domain-containing protein [Schizothecium vesticola]
MESPTESKPAPKQCSACQVSFETDDARRTHSKSSWHVENIRRRVAGLDPIDASPLPPSPTPDSKQKSSKRGKSTRPPPRSDDDDDDDGSSSDTSPSLPDDTPTPFTREQCLFCPTASASFSSSLTHMHQAHGLFIPSPERLVVDLETLIRYLHLVIFQYRECLSCATQRRTPAAAQQHMLAKGHCNFDLDRAESEYRDFYDLATSGAAPPGGGGQQDSAHLPSGKIVAPRTAAPTSQARLPARPPPEIPSPSIPPPPSNSTDTPASPSLELTARVAKRQDLLASQLAHLSASDRASLAHLPTSQQLAVLGAQQRQADAETRKERRLRTRVEFLDQKTVPKAIANDLPWKDSRYPGR